MASGDEVDAVLQQALQRLALLAEATTALSSTLEVEEGLRRLCRTLLPQLGDWCAVDLLDEHGHPHRRVVAHYEPDRLPTGHLEGPLPDVPETSADPLARVLRGAGPLLLDGRSALASDGGPTLGAQRELFELLGARTVIIAPLRARRQVLGALTLARTRDGAPLTPADLPLVEDLAQRTALAVDNNALHASVQRIAERLQRSLLPPLPDIRPLELAARYLPARAAAEVGGDWYDCFVLPDGVPALIIGDVTGHDLPSAVTMSQLRNMLRALACDRREPPGDVLRRLDAITEILYGGHTATCVFARLETGPAGAWRLRYANAGHPPPLLITQAGDTRFLEAGHGVLLGVEPHRVRPDGVEPMPADSTLLLYTDGLIERPGESLEEGLARLRQHAAALAREPLDTFCDELLSGLGDSADDIAVLAARMPSAAPADAPGAAL
ncbi:PP2C family protein-serine/threonine phosphatase [Streptomyces sp. NPDC018031]|uniref:PP2C family protein-serine/threonine phosphatase n=1 Tax=Streptomyces sp. NPDC018031 TaxID=3365033 RepID=UPI0037964051